MDPIFNIYIDKLFVDKLYARLTSSPVTTLEYIDENEVYNSFYQFLKNMVFVNLFTNISLNDLNDSDKKYKYILNRGNFFPLVKPEFFEDLYEFAKHLKQPGFTLFLAENKKAITDKPKLNHMFLSVEDIKSSWLEIVNNSLQSFGIYDQCLESWNFLKNIIHPLNTIIIIDPYLKSCREVLDANLKIILNKLLKGYNRKDRLDLVFFFNENHINTSIGSKNITIEAFFAWVKQLLVSENVIEYNLVFIDSKKMQFHDLNKEHNRFIITNYWKIQSGRSFDFLKSDGSATGSYDYIFFSFVFDPKALNTLKDIIYRLNKRFNGNLKSSDFTQGKYYNRLINI